MATYSKIPLSGSTNGKGIAVAATSTPGTTLHTAGSGTTNFDEVWLYAMNSASASVDLTVEYGGTTSTDTIQISIPSQSGLVLVVPGLFINNSLEVAGFADTSNAISIHGYVNRVS